MPRSPPPRHFRSTAQLQPYQIKPEVADDFAGEVMPLDWVGNKFFYWATSACTAGPAPALRSCRLDR